MQRVVPAFGCFRCAVRPWVGSPTVLARRPLTSSSQGLPSETLTTDADTIGDFEFDSMGEEGSETPRSYRAFMEKTGYIYRFARPQNWLGHNVPFPMNPSFRPPPPISDYQREIMWQLFSRNNQTFSVRRLAKRFNLSIKRVDAILRLKGMEKDWIKVEHYHLVPTYIADILFRDTWIFIAGECPNAIKFHDDTSIIIRETEDISVVLFTGKEIQTGFLQGMERLLNAQTHAAVPRMIELLHGTEKNANERDVLPERLDVHRADMLEQREKRDATPYRYERSYWESIPEDADGPILPNILQHIKKRAEVKRLLAWRKKKHFMTSVPNTQFIRRPRLSLLMRNRKNRPGTKFVDVGAEFIDVKQLAKRASVAARKSSIRATKGLEKAAALKALRRTD